MRRFFLVGLIAGLMVESGCGQEPERPRITDVRLALTAAPGAGRPSAPVTLRAQVTNAGNVFVWHCSGCGCGEGFQITVLGPDGSAVALHDPKALGPMCPDGSVRLEPAQTLESGDRFTGVLYQRDSPSWPSPTYQAPSGTYTVIAIFNYVSSVPGEWVGLERRTRFVWQP